jgi:hypothetical protein
LKKALIAAFSLWSLSGSSGIKRTRRPIVLISLRNAYLCRLHTSDVSNAF